MGIEFKSLTVRNFLSFGNVPTTVILNRPGTTLILGEDLDHTSTGAGANGVGKTSILNALVYAVFDKPISDIGKDNLVNNVNKKNMEVMIEFSANGKDYKIHRARKMKTGAAGNWVHLFENGKDITPDSVNNTNELIEKIIGINYELFVRIIAFSANHTPFLDLPVRSHYAASQTGIIEELFDLKTLSAKAEALKEQIKSTELSLNSQIERVELIEAEHERHANQIESAQKRVVNWEKQNKQDIKDLQVKLQKIHNVDIDHQKQLHDEVDKLEDDVIEAESAKRKVDREVKALAKVIKDKTQELTHLRDEKCPYCLQSFADADAKIKETLDIVEESEALFATLEEESGQMQVGIDQLHAKIDAIKNDIVVNDITELLDIKSKVSQYESKIADLTAAVNPFIEPLEELESIELETIDRKEINERKNTLDHQKFLLKLLTKKDSFVRKALLNKNIPYLNKRLTQYLQDLGLPHTVEFTHEMTASISQFGRHMDFGNLSNGQRARVNLALSFAFRDVLQSMHQAINVCMLDEVLDVGLDAIGVQAAAKMLKRKSRDENIAMYIISHRDEIDSAFDHKLIVQMSKGFSFLNFED